jgi:tellurite resistance protein TerC
MWFWIGFLVLVFILLALDLGVFNRRSHVISTREAAGWTTLWVSLSLLFSIFIYFAYENNWLDINHSATPMSGMEAALDYLTGYLVEQSLSMDNIFVIALIFAYFKVPDQYQHRVLFWGILGALFFRGIMIAFGIVLIQQFDWIIYVFGAFLLYSAYKMLTANEEVHPNKNPTIRLLRRYFPITKSYYGDKFFVKIRQFHAGTPLFVALVMVETTDIMFAFDSIPAIFAITTDPFLVFTSNIFAILGLRSLYFVLANMLNRFIYLKYSLVFILVFVALKMLAHEYVHLPSWLSLVVIFVALASGVIASLMSSAPETDPKEERVKEAKTEG